MEYPYHGLVAPGHLGLAGHYWVEDPILAWGYYRGGLVDLKSLLSAAGS
jgi:hypothetical protein